MRGGAADGFQIFSPIPFCRLLPSKQGKTNAGQDFQPAAMLASKSGAALYG